MITDNAFTTPKDLFPHPRNCPVCIAAKDRARRIFLARGYDEDTAERLSRVVVTARLACGWHS